MSKAKKAVIGFVGSDKAEIIHYASRVLLALQQKVLLLDLSETGALNYSVPRVGEAKIFDYRGVDVTMEKESDFSVYDFVYIDFGFHLQDPYIKLCDRIVIVTDLQIHNVKRLIPLELLKEQERMLLVKDIVRGKIGQKYVINELSHLGITLLNCKEFYYDERDLTTMLNCEYNSIFSFQKISWEQKQAVVSLITPYFDIGEIKKVYKTAEGGR